MLSVTHSSRRSQSRLSRLSLEAEIDKLKDSISWLVSLKD
jgi:hypothetical protein